MQRTDWDARYSSADLVWSAEPNRWVEAELSDAAPGMALDLAAGEARNAIWLAGLGWTVTAADFSHVALSKGRRLAESFDDDRASRIRWLDVDLTDYTPEPGRYDLVLIVYLHVVATQRHYIVGRAVAALAPGGTLLVVGHDTTNIADGVGGPQDSSVLFTPDDIVADLATSGLTLRIEKAERVLRPVEGADRPAIDALVRAVALGE